MHTHQHPVQVDKIPAGPCRWKIQIDVPSERLEEEKTCFLQSAAKAMDLPGFRKGKVPVEVARKHLGDSLDIEAKHHILDHILGETLRETELDILTVHGLDRDGLEIPEEGPLQFDFEVETSPTVELVPWTDLDIEAWWPNGDGEQRLYDLVIELLDGDGATLDRVERRIGFKHVEWTACEAAPEGADPWLCVVNGRPIFLRGINWSPIRPNFADVPEPAYRLRLEQYRDLNMNTLRTNGCGLQDKQCFYNLCDELGLLVWHKAARHPWGVRGRTLVGMLAESIVFAVGLFLLARLQWWAHGHWSLAISPGETVVAARLVSYVGAGVYEEVLFRLCLLPCCWTVLRGLGYRRWVAMAGAVVVTSLFFAAAHHLGTTGEAFGWFAFSFRTLAGLVFGGLFVARGFGITVGAHVAYDLLIGVMFVTA